MDMIQLAIDTAARAHRAQLRKGTDIPYISHPFGVGMLLMEAGCRPEVITAGLLHDTLEDTELTKQDLIDTFGEEVTEIVIGCSEADKSKSWEERKQYKIEDLKTASEDVRFVVCADKLSNLRATAAAYQQEGDQVWSRFRRGRKDQEWYYREILASLSCQSEFPMLRMLRQENCIFVR